MLQYVRALRRLIVSKRVGVIQICPDEQTLKSNFDKGTSIDSYAVWLSQSVVVLRDLAIYKTIGAIGVYADEQTY